ncbi:OB-fold nucleic acid binding domain-containing protein, partial [Lactococcus lactis]
MKDLISIIDVKDHVGETVKIGAWVADKSGKGKLQFLQLRDGTAFFQAVVFKPNMIENFGEEIEVSLYLICQQPKRRFLLFHQ